MVRGFYGLLNKQCFQDMKVLMKKALVLQFPAWDCLFYVKIYASGLGIRKALTQEHLADVCLPVV